MNRLVRELVSQRLHRDLQLGHPSGESLQGQPRCGAHDCEVADRGVHATRAWYLTLSCNSTYARLLIASMEATGIACQCRYN